MTLKYNDPLTQHWLSTVPIHHPLKSGCFVAKSQLSLVEPPFLMARSQFLIPKPWFLMVISLISSIFDGSILTFWWLNHHFWCWNMVKPLNFRWLHSPQILVVATDSRPTSLPPSASETAVMPPSAPAPAHFCLNSQLGLDPPTKKGRLKTARRSISPKLRGWTSQEKYSVAGYHPRKNGRVMKKSCDLTSCQPHMGVS